MNYHVLNNFLITNEKLGSGGTSDVFLGYDLRNRSGHSGATKQIPVALKRSAISRTSLKDWDREVTVLHSLQGEANVMKLIDVLFQSSDDYVASEGVAVNGKKEAYVYQVFELIDGKDLLEMFNSSPHLLTENVIRVVFYQIVEAIHRCHKRGVVHLDIKPENIMYDYSKDQIVLIDFGFAEIIDLNNPSTLTKKSGSIEYCAPEVYYSNKYDGRPADVWSLGVLLYVLLFHKFPFSNQVRKSSSQDHKKRVEEIFMAKLTGDSYLASLQSTPNVSPSLISLLRSMLQPNPDYRLTTSQIMTHEWFAPLHHKKKVIHQ